MSYHRRINRTFLNNIAIFPQSNDVYFDIVSSQQPLCTSPQSSFITIAEVAAKSPLGLQLVGDWFLDRPSINSMNKLNCDNMYRQFGGHKNKENKSSKIEFNFVIVCFGLFWVFIHVRLAIQRIRNFALLDKKLFIYLIQNFRWFTYLMLRGVQRILEEPLNTPVRSGIKYL